MFNSARYAHHHHTGTPAPVEQGRSAGGDPHWGWNWETVGGRTEEVVSAEAECSGHL